MTSTVSFERQAGLVPTAMRFDGVLIVGAGAIGSHVAELLARYNFQNVTIMDADTVAEYNVPGQFMALSAAGTPKVHAVQRLLQSLGLPLVGWSFEPVNWEVSEIPGCFKLIILAVDSVPVRQSIANWIRASQLLVDFRMGIEDGSILFVSSNGINGGMSFSEYADSLNVEFDEVPACGPRAMPSTAKCLVALGIGHLIACAAGRATMHRRINFNIGSGEMGHEIASVSKRRTILNNTNIVLSDPVMEAPLSSIIGDEITQEGD